ncbi:MAG: hypothetical protein KatS3mg082_0445 [Nitrospiraceae bacterium]|nr:MAG: hypothetical protein KatS3mg082_0445 [Nitrospiraceae bacterium]
MDLEIESRNVAMTPRWKTEIEERVHDLQRGHRDLIHVRVTLTKNRHHKKLKNVAEALVVITLSGRHTITARKEDKTFEEAIRAAFDAVAIELRKVRGETRDDRNPDPTCAAVPRRDLQIVSRGGVRIHSQGRRRRGVLPQERAP